MANLTKTFNGVKAYIAFSNYTTLNPLSSGENIADSLGKIRAWYQLGFGIDIQESENDGNFKWKAISKDGTGDTYHEVHIKNVATLDESGKVKKEQLPSYVDDIYEGIMTNSANSFYQCPGTEPEDWATNYTDYYTYNSSTHQFEPVTGSTPPTWVKDTYYKPIANGTFYRCPGEKPEDWSTAYNNYFTYDATKHSFEQVTDETEPEWTERTYYKPITGEPGKIYVDTQTNKQYRWSGTQYTEISGGTLEHSITIKNDGSVFKTFNGTEDIAVDFVAGTGITITKGTAAADLDKLTFIANEMVGITYVENAYVAGIAGIVPAPPISSGNQSYVKTTASGYEGECTENPIGSNGFLRSDGVWSNEPVIENDILVFNCVAG